MAAQERYRVTERLESGGMAEVFKGEALSLQGFKKQVAIKRVLPHLAQNKGFISMFLDEARLGARLNHANVVSVFDIGTGDNTYFIVMEFVDGCNLKTVIEHYRAQGKRVGVKDAIYITMEACRGLSYAHELTDDDGGILGLVHRDISPPNILLSKRGEVKVTDFGLAKASTQLEKTDPGVVKGKFSYLSPEAALGETVDERTDIFAMGIVLWEMLAGRRLFLGENDYQTVKLVQAAQVPSLSRLNPEVDEELEAIILNSLTRDPNERFRSAREFGDSLAGYLFGKKLKVTSYDIAALVKQVVEERRTTSAQQRPEHSIIDRLIQEELLRFTSLGEQEGEEPQRDSDGGVPLDAGLFENPQEWFSNDEDLGPTAAHPSEGWHESGIEQLPPSMRAAVATGEHEREEEPEGATTVMSRESFRIAEQQQLASQVPAKAPSPPQPSRAPALTPIAPAQPRTSGKGLSLFFGLLVLVAGVGAAWFLGWIPR